MGSKLESALESDQTDKLENFDMGVQLSADGLNKLIDCARGNNAIKKDGTIKPDFVKDLKKKAEKGKGKAGKEPISVKNVKLDADIASTLEKFDESGKMTPELIEEAKKKVAED